MDSTDISTERWNLDKERREAVKNLLYDFDHNYYYPKVKKLWKRCEEETGHNFRFSHFGPLGHVWYYCSLCRLSKVENP